MPKWIPGVGSETWTVDIKLIWQTGLFGIKIEHRNAEESFACLTNECARKKAESTICELLIPFLYSKEEIRSGDFEEIVKYLNSTSSKFCSKFPDYIYGLEIGNFGLRIMRILMGGWRFVVGDEEEKIEDEYGVVQEDGSSNMAALGKETVALVKKRMEEAREG
ncbi:hypothetical protein BCON_0181g00120 [Botryotinia convoluta]|uniref:Uncharacterized protein n=1 Tax=Botryotinia convoluta TaxID=54673 RepID=A0A4Z1HP05_9HELO|nr:hypothetical protein BCON_0181g00120 [Botryotinia convoluta]